MSFRASILLALSLTIILASALTNNGENEIKESKNVVQGYFQKRSPPGAKEKPNIVKNKNIRYSNKKQRKQKKTKNQYNRMLLQNNSVFNVTTEISQLITATEITKTQSCQCGLANLPETGRVIVGEEPGRVIGGEKIDPPRKYPWLVLVKIKKRGTCSGSLISSRHILSAGHCVHIKGKKFIPSKDVKVYIGDHNVKKKDDDLPGETSIMKVEKIITHPKFKSTLSKIDYDIVLLKLAKNLDLNQFQDVRPICLPENARTTYFNIEAICAGWGLTKSSAFKIPNIPYEITLKTTDKNCRGYRKKKKNQITKTMICTDVKWEKETPYFGDSGGPLMVEEDGRYIEIGIVSGGRTKTGKEGSKSLAVYTSVTKLFEWIEGIIKDDNRCI